MWVWPCIPQPGGASGTCVFTATRAQPPSAPLLTGSWMQSTATDNPILADTDTGRSAMILTWSGVWSPSGVHGTALWSSG